MRIAILSDIHSNLPALQAVFSSLEKSNIDKVYCLGDIVGYGPYPNECIEIIKEKCNGVVGGNHDFGVVEKVALKNFNKPGKKAIEWTRKHTSENLLQYIKNLPLRIEEHDITFVHSSPLSTDSWTYIYSMDEAREAFTALNTTLCFIGHTHIPTMICEDGSMKGFRKENRFIINVGSVGQPRDGNPDAAYGVFDTNRWLYDLIRVEYEFQKSADAIIKAGLPKILADRLRYGF